MADNVKEGGCACGALRYQLRGEPIFVNNCHCTQCQRQTGSTSVVNMFYEMDRVTQISGATSRHKVKAGSGGIHVIVRCTECGTAVWSHYPGLGDHGGGVRGGTLDDPSAVRPDAVIYTAERMPWVSLPDDIPCFEGYYKAADVLPPDRFARLKALARKAADQ